MAATTVPNRTGNKRGFGGNLREEIIAAAERLLAHAGSHETVTLRAIAREAGIATPSIYPHFADRDAILDAVVARTFTELEQTCRSAADSTRRGRAEVEAISLAYVQFARDHPGKYRILFERTQGNIASPAHQYAEGIAAFALVVDAVTRWKPAMAADAQQTMLDAQSLFVALHGIATLPVALPGFPWQDDDALLRNVISKIFTRTRLR